ncbi:MAG TPA: hypothetical protein VFO76_00030 [Candidatus Kapabacteria bacterium]|nr:hypothetical protein [Candidatus Kapabacteria bacterium]
MSEHTYKVYVEGNTIRWIDPPPANLKSEGTITIPEETALIKGDGKVIAEILERIAETGLITDEWVKEWEESRTDKPRKGREY